MTKVTCAWCGGALEERQREWVHQNGNPYCAGKDEVHLSDPSDSTPVVYHGEWKRAFPTFSGGPKS